MKSQCNHLEQIYIRIRGLMWICRCFQQKISYLHNLNAHQLVGWKPSEAGLTQASVQPNYLRLIRLAVSLIPFELKFLNITGTDRAFSFNYLLKHTLTEFTSGAMFRGKKQHEWRIVMILLLYFIHCQILLFLQVQQNWMEHSFHHVLFIYTVYGFVLSMNAKTKDSRAFGSKIFG